MSISIGSMAKLISQPPNTKMLTWNPKFAATRSGLFCDAQKYVDSECLRLCSPLVPFQTGNLMRSGTNGTKIGSGEVSYNAPYASHQYYNTADSRSYDPRRGAHWFDRMKTAHASEILAGARRIANG